MTVGIDVGSTTTKVVGLGTEGPFGFHTVQAAGTSASSADALAGFLERNSLPPSAVSRIGVTGVRARDCAGLLLGIPCRLVEEFQAIGRGGLRLSGLPQAIAVSMGTGTSFVRATSSECRHLGGTGVGGGTLLGLSERMLGTTDFREIVELASGGNLANVDLRVSDLAPAAVPGLAGELTASNFGRLGGPATRADCAIGILNLVFQTIGMMAVFAAAPFGEQNVVLTGKLSAVPQAPAIFAGFAALSPLRFLIPPRAEYATAVGAALLA